MSTKAKKLPSGNWRARVSYKGEDGKRHFQSFTASTKKEAEYMAAEFELDKAQTTDTGNLTMGEAIDQYIELKRPLLSPTTIHRYEWTRKIAFQDIMGIPLRKITSEMLDSAVKKEMKRPKQYNKGTQSAKSVKNAYGLISAVLNRFLPEKTFRVDLPRVARQIRTLPEPAAVYEAVRGTDIELACLLAMWLSFTESEIRGLTKSNSIDGDYITIREVMVSIGSKSVTKELAKTDTRIRRHKMPPHIKDLVDAVEGDVLVPFTASCLYKKFKRKIHKAGLPDISFHDLRHINASVMAVLRIPDKYAQERGGWATDNIMKTVYTETFSEERERVDAVIDGYFEKIVKN